MIDNSLKIRCLKKTNYKDVSLNLFDSFKNIKLIVFDFDDTLYQNIGWHGFNDFVLKNTKEIFANLSQTEFENMLCKYNFTGDRIIESLAYITLKEKGSTKEFCRFVESIKFEGDYTAVKIFPADILKDLAKKYTLYILSNSSVPNIKFVSSRINLDLKPFKKIYSNQFKKEDLSKTKRLKDILKQSKLNPSQILMVGDSIQYDLLPAKQLGMQVLLVE